MSERDFQRMIIELATLLRYSVYHVYDSRMCTTAGFPDLCLLRESPPRYVMAELKSDRGRVTLVQQRWIDGLKASGVEAYIWRPAMWETIVEILRA